MIGDLLIDVSRIYGINRTRYITSSDVTTKASVVALYDALSIPFQTKKLKSEYIDINYKREREKERKREIKREASFTHKQIHIQITYKLSREMVLYRKCAERETREI